MIFLSSRTAFRALLFLLRTISLERIWRPIWLQHGMSIHACDDLKICFVRLQPQNECTRCLNLNFRNICSHFYKYEPVWRVLECDRKSFQNIDSSILTETADWPADTRGASSSPHLWLMAVSKGSSLETQFLAFCNTTKTFTNYTATEIAAYFGVEFLYSLAAILLMKTMYWIGECNCFNTCEEIFREGQSLQCK
jgi:hypothetical protein